MDFLRNKLVLIIDRKYKFQLEQKQLNNNLFFLFNFEARRMLTIFRERPTSNKTKQANYFGIFFTFLNSSK